MQHKAPKLAPLIAVLALSAIASAAPAFEVAAIKPSPIAVRQGLFNVRIDKSQVSITGLRLTAVIAMAWRVHESQVLGPGWLTTTAFNIVAKIPAGSTPAEVPEMLQTLLSERFGLTLHKENRDLPVYSITVSKSGLKMKERLPASTPAEPLPDDAQIVQTPLGEMTMSGSGNARRLAGSGVAISMGQNGTQLAASKVSKLAALLSADSDRPVIDDTGLTGDYAIAVDFSEQRDQHSPPALPGQPAASDPDDNPEFAMIERQLGLHIAARKASIPALIIEHMEKTPTEN